MYTDPATKLQVLTRYTHLQRGKCCGSQCRHVCLDKWFLYLNSLFSSSVHMVMPMWKLISINLENYSTHPIMNEK